MIRGAVIGDISDDFDIIAVNLKMMAYYTDVEEIDCGFFSESSGISDCEIFISEDTGLGIIDYAQCITNCCDIDCLDILIPGPPHPCLQGFFRELNPDYIDNLKAPIEVSTRSKHVSKDLIVGNGGNQSVSIYPNPTSDDFSMLLKGLKNNEATMQIFDVTGHEIYKSNYLFRTDSELIKINELGLSPSGIYFIRLISDGGWDWDGRLIKFSN